MSEGLGSGPSLSADELAAAIAAGQELGQNLEPQAVEAYLRRVEDAIDARVDARVEELIGQTGRSRDKHNHSFTGRLLGSIAIGIPLTAVAGDIARGAAGGAGAVFGVLGVLAAIVTLNVYYTEKETEPESEHNRRDR
jgi:hypothetical protein